LRAFLLAAGDGTRMWPLTSNMSKSLLPVAGKPFLQHTLEVLKECKVNDVTILVKDGKREIEQYFGSGSNFGMKIDYLVQKKPLGTANAVGVASESINEPFLSINGDVLVNVETIDSLLQSFKKDKASIVTFAPVESPQEFGVIEEKGGRLVRILEKSASPPSNLANTGIYLFTPEIFKWIEKTEKSPRGEYEITDTLTMMAAGEDIRCVKYSGNWIDVGRPWDLLRANSILMAGIKREIRGEVQPNATLEGEVIVGTGTRVMNGAYIVGPAIIGENCQIGPNCYIRPSTSLGNNCKVGNATEIKNSILMDGAKAPHHNYVGDSILGRRCNLGSGTKVANLRLDDRTIRVSLKGKILDSGLRKLGVIIGDDVKVGINASLDPGTIIGERSFIGPGAFASGTISAGSKIY
jgi:UDP-N-acetylglucosamine diphosphorylase/glucosamine-1-phosphate N-acetyltransferase